jgi:hypothetical protein
MAPMKNQASLGGRTHLSSARTGAGRSALRTSKCNCGVLATWSNHDRRVRLVVVTFSRSHPTDYETIQCRMHCCMPHATSCIRNACSRMSYHALSTSWQSKSLQWQAYQSQLDVYCIFPHTAIANLHFYAPSLSRRFWCTAVQNRCVCICYFSMRQEMHDGFLCYAHTDGNLSCCCRRLPYSPATCEPDSPGGEPRAGKSMVAVQNY